MKLMKLSLLVLLKYFQKWLTLFCSGSVPASHFSRPKGWLGPLRSHTAGSMSGLGPLRSQSRGCLGRDVRYPGQLLGSPLQLLRAYRAGSWHIPPRLLGLRALGGHGALGVGAQTSTADLHSWGLSTSLQQRGSFGAIHNAQGHSISASSTGSLLLRYPGDPTKHMRASEMASEGSLSPPPPNLPATNSRGDFGFEGLLMNFPSDLLQRLLPLPAPGWCNG